ncbi:MAG: hypothetical protein CMJ86_07700 [Planctomycetes bacterium]|jgi:hypothetical protein|nr:hypothetical protein [Planctomycetota bacterium]MDP6370011.1 hypothetical protein [Planctomycetota bacterium]
MSSSLAGNQPDPENGSSEPLVDSTTPDTAKPLNVPRWVSLRGTPRQVLKRLLSGDPLRLHRLVRAYIDEHTLLLDSEVVHDEVCVAIAESVGLDEYSDSEEFLLELVDRVVRGILKKNCKPLGAWSVAWKDVGMKPEVCWQAVEIINRLEQLEREVVHRAFLDGVAFEQVVEEFPLNRFETQVILRDVARAIGSLDDPDLSAEGSSE